jgi:hypothetical protein
MLSAATRKDLLRRLGGERGSKLSVTRANVFGTEVVHAEHQREVPLAGLDKSLRGVVALAHEPVTIGASGAGAAVMGAMPQAADTEHEVASFVKSLLQHDRIDFGKARKSAAGLAKAKAGATHVVATVGGKKVLRRVRFHCAG